MKSRQQKLMLSQADRKLEPFQTLNSHMMPARGWIHTIRTALGMSLRQLGQRLGKPAQSIQDFEKREENRTITLQSLHDIANALDLQLVYALIPKDGSLEAVVKKQAISKAREIIERTNTTMQLEDQGNSRQRLEQSLQEKTDELIKEMPKFLWD